MTGNTITVPPMGTFSPNIPYAEIDISDGASASNGIDPFAPGPAPTATTRFVFLGPHGTLSTAGSPYFTGAISDFQAGDQLVLVNPGVPFNIPNNPMVVWNSFSYDPTTESLNFLMNGTVTDHLTITEQVVGQYATSSFKASLVFPGPVPDTSITVSTPAVAASVTVPTTRAAATVTAAPGVEHVTAPGLDLTTLLGQSLDFIDGTLAFDRAAFLPPGTHLPTLYRLYQTALGRDPDRAGENFWNSQMNGGLTPAQIAATLVSGANQEYVNRFAYFGWPSDTAFVTNLYQNGLGRAPDAAGLAYWTGALASGAARADILLQIAQSPEAILHNTQLASTGVFTPHG
jgi:hypothetical protein